MSADPLDVFPPEMRQQIVEGRQARKELIARRQTGEDQRPEWCICHDSFWMRGLDDHACRHDEIEEREDELARYRALGSVDDLTAQRDRIERLQEEAEIDADELESAEFRRDQFYVERNETRAALALYEALGSVDDLTRAVAITRAVDAVYSGERYPDGLDVDYEPRAAWCQGWDECIDNIHERAGIDPDG